MVRDRLHLQETNGTPALMVVVMLIVTSFGTSSRADVYVTGVDNGTTTTISFIGSLNLPPPTVVNLLKGSGELYWLDTGGISKTYFFLTDPAFAPDPSLMQKHVQDPDDDSPLFTLGFYKQNPEIEPLYARALLHSGDSFVLDAGDLLISTGYTNGSPLAGETVFEGTGLPIDLTTPFTLSISGSDSKIFFNIDPPSLDPTTASNAAAKSRLRRKIKKLKAKIKQASRSKAKKLKKKLKKLKKQFKAL